MALMTTAECRDLLDITGFTYDELIARYLPYVEEDIIAYVGHPFRDRYVYRESIAALQFVRGDSSTHDYITDGDEDFLERGFGDNMDIFIEGGYANVGLYHCSSASTGRLYLEEYGELINQDQDGSADDHNIGAVRISRVKWPRAIKVVAAKMVWHLIKNMQSDKDVQSESLDDYSVTYAGMGNAYPSSVLRGLNQWRQVRMK